MPKENIHRPWELSAQMNGYPMPIVDEKKARKFAADKIYSIRKNTEHKQETKQIVKKHASRKQTTKRKKVSGSIKKDGDKKQSSQGELMF